MDPQTANGAYGFSTWTQAVPGGMAIMPETHIGASGDVPSAVLPKLPLIGNNPLMWLLAFGLIWSGYVYGAFDIGFKNIAKTGVKVGRR